MSNIGPFTKKEVIDVIEVAFKLGAFEYAKRLGLQPTVDFVEKIWQEHKDMINKELSETPEPNEL